jgi:hypothetical protein
MWRDVQNEHSRQNWGWHSLHAFEEKVLIRDCFFGHGERLVCSECETTSSDCGKKEASDSFEAEGADTEPVRR